jgi:hypothetical protein
MAFETTYREEVVQQQQYDSKKVFDNLPKPFKEVKYVKTKKGTEFLVIREGTETWLSVNYVGAIIDNGRKPKARR